MVVSLPEIDRLNWHKSECEEKLAMTMAGKAAEIIKYGSDNVSNGPAGDIQQASPGLARAMVLRWGMSKLEILTILKLMKVTKVIQPDFQFLLIRRN